MPATPAWAPAPRPCDPTRLRARAVAPRGGRGRIGFDEGMERMVERFREQADACRTLGSPMYADLLHRLAADLEEHGVPAVLVGHEDDPGPSALAIRLLGSVHRLVLSGAAPALAPFYPSVGGSWDLEAAWPVLRAFLDERAAEIGRWLDSPPQTNEVGRAGALMGGLLQLPIRLPVRLFEIGSSGGLNLRVDRFCHVDEAGREHGDLASVVRLEPAWRGRPLEPWPDLEIVERLGSDVAPVDVATEEGRLTLTSYVWADQTARLERLRGALAVAQEVPAEVRRERAADFVQGVELAPGTVTVLWHSVMWQYLSGDEQRAVAERIAALGEQAIADRPFAHLLLEPRRRTPDSDHEFLVVLQSWPGGERRILGASVGHGLPTTWE